MPVQPLFDLRPDTAGAAGARPLSCVSCGLYRGVLTPAIPPYGAGRRRVMIVGEGPGETEDRSGKPWQGAAGRLLHGLLGDLGLNLARDCVSTNAVNCRPPRNRTPTSYEVACCRQKIVSPAIAEYAPRVILLMGGSAVTSVLGPLCDRSLGDAIGRWRGLAIPVPDWGAWVCPTFHPSYVLREEKRAEVATVWRRDVRAALRLLDVPVPPSEDLRSLVRILRDEDEVVAALRRARDADLLSYDYETTGLRASLHEVVCASLATSEREALAFMMPRSGPVVDAWTVLMSDVRVGKISHNMKFEAEWTREHYGVEEVNWAWDSMVAAHVVDNRRGICGLKHQAFLRFGIQSWEDLIEPYLKAVNPRDPKSPNRILEFIERYGEKECLVYCGIDSLVAFRLAMRQRREIGGKVAA